MATINVTKNGTLNPALSRIDNDDLTTTPYVSADTLSITADVRLTINTHTFDPAADYVVPSNTGYPGSYGSVTFTAATKAIVAAVGTPFAGAVPGDQFFVHGTTSNSKIFTIATWVSATSVTSVETCVNETAANAMICSAQNRPANLYAIGAFLGEIYITNASTTTPIIISLTGAPYDFVAQGSNKLTVEGAPIQIGVGTGAAGQTFSFASVGGVSIDNPPIIWVETFAGSNDYVPYFNIGDSTTTQVNGGTSDSSAIALTDFAGDQIHGPVFKYNRNTQIASFGDGTNGAVVPLNAKMLIPNIHFTCSSQDPSLTSRSELRAGSGGRVSMKWCSVAEPVTTGGSIGFYQSGDLNFEYVGFSGSTYLSSQCTGDLTAFKVACSPSHSSALLSVGLRTQYVAGTTSLDGIYGLTKCTGNGATTYGILLLGLYNVSKLDNLYGWCIAPLGAVRIGVGFNIVNGDENEQVVGKIRAIGGCFYVSTSKNLYVPDIEISDQCRGIAGQTSAQGTQGVRVEGVTQNLVIGKVRKIAGGAACRLAVVSMTSDCTQCAAKDVVYDGGASSESGVLFTGSRLYAANFICDNMRAGIAGSTTPINRKGTRLSNMKGYAVGIPAIGSGMNSNIEYDVLSGMQGASTAGLKNVTPIYVAYTNAGYTQGHILLTGSSPNGDYPFVTSPNPIGPTTWYQEMINTLYVIGNNQEVTVSSPYPIRGITGFTTAVWTGASTGIFGGTVQRCRIRVHSIFGDQPWSAWFDPAVGANWQSAFSALVGYDSNVGMNVEYRLQTVTGPVAGRGWLRGRITCDMDPAFVATEIGFIPIVVSGAVAGSSIAAYDNDAPLSPVLSDITSGTGATMDVPYNFDHSLKNWKIVVRKPGYGEIVATGASRTAGASLPVSPILAVTVDEVAAAALTGIAIDGTTETVTVSETHSLAELYAYCQWWAAQPRNMGYPVPLATLDGAAHTSGYDWSIDAGIALTGAGSVALGAKSLTMGAGASSAFDWSYSGKAWTRVTLTGLTTGSRVRVATGVEIFNGVVVGTSLEVQREWTVDQTLDVRVTYCSGTTAKLPWQQSAVFGSTGASVLVAQLDDTIYAANGVDGSTVAEYTADYANVQVDLSDGDGYTTVQRGYAWYVYNLSTSLGITNYFGAMTAEDAANYRINTAVVGLQIQNVGTNAVWIGGARIYRDDGANLTIPGNGPIQMEPAKAYIAQTLLPNAVLDANVVKVNNVTVTGNGSATTPWGPL